MRQYQFDPASGCKLIGGEMLHWSDLSGDRSPGGAAPFLMRLLPSLPDTSRVLLAGPRAALLVDVLPERLSVDVLVRGLPDARELSNSTRVRRDVTVYCGSVDRFDTVAEYGLVVALDGPDVLMSPDNEGIGSAELLEKLSGWLSTDGVLMATVVNELGCDRMFRLGVYEDHRLDSAWHRGATGYDDRHTYHHELESRLNKASLTPLATYAAFPAVDSPTLLVSEAVSDETYPSVRAAAGTLAARLESEHFAKQPAVVDAHDLALRIFQGGLAVELSPLWLVVAQRGGAQNAPELALPLVVASGEGGRPDWRAVTTIERADGDWSYRVSPVSNAVETRERTVLRDFSAQTGSLPQGDTLEVLLRRACGVNNVTEVRRLVRRYAEWLRDPQPSPDKTADGRFFMVPANVVSAGESLAPVDPTWFLAAEQPWEALVVHGLRDFSRRLLASAAEHPWTPDISPNALTQTLSAMAGIEWDASIVDRIALSEAEVATVLNGGDATYEAVAYRANLEGGQSQAATVGPSRGYREAMAFNGRLSESLHERNEQVSWLEASLRARDVRLAELERTVSHIRASLSFRIGRAVTWPLRVWVGVARRLGMSMVPPAYIHKAKRLAQRLAAK